MINGRKEQASDTAPVLELPDRELKIIMINVLRASSKKSTACEIRWVMEKEGQKRQEKSKDEIRDTVPDVKNAFAVCPLRQTHSTANQTHPVHLSSPPPLQLGEPLSLMTILRRNTPLALDLGRAWGWIPATPLARRGIVGKLLHVSVP